MPVLHSVLCLQFSFFAITLHLAWYWWPRIQNISEFPSCLPNSLKTTVRIRTRTVLRGRSSPISLPARIKEISVSYPDTTTTIPSTLRDFRFEKMMFGLFLISKQVLGVSFYINFWCETKTMNIPIFKRCLLTISTGTTWTQEMSWLIGNDLDYEGAKVILPTRFPYFEWV